MQYFLLEIGAVDESKQFALKKLEVKTMLAESVIEWTQKWKAEGWQEGEQRGVQKGQARLLQKQLESRFGPLPDWALIRLKDSNEAELERWCLRVLTQSNLQEILA